MASGIAGLFDSIEKIVRRHEGSSHSNLLSSSPLICVKRPHFSSYFNPLVYQPAVMSADFYSDPPVVFFHGSNFSRPIEFL